MVLLQPLQHAATSTCSKRNEERLLPMVSLQLL
jgi:hypothetical protein